MADIDNRKQHKVYYDGWNYVPDKQWPRWQRQWYRTSNVRRRKRMAELERRRAQKARTR